MKDVQNLGARTSLARQNCGQCGHRPCAWACRAGLQALQASHGEPAWKLGKAAYQPYCSVTATAVGPKVGNMPREFQQERGEQNERSVARGPWERGPVDAAPAEGLQGRWMRDAHHSHERTRWAKGGEPILYGAW